MYCLGCRYSLKGLQSPRCPECGRGFDPADASTFDLHWHRRRDWIKRMALVMSFYPLAFIFLFYATWFAAAASLGHWPRPSADDPKFINWAVSGLHDATWVAILFASPAMAINLLAIVADIPNKIRCERQWFWGSLSMFGVLLINWTIAFALIRIDPGRVMVWFMD